MHLVQGLGNLIVHVRCKIHQQMIGCSENVGGLNKSEMVSFQMMTERNYLMTYHVRGVSSSVQIIRRQVPCVISTSPVY